MNIEVLARYPFLDEGQEYLKNIKLVDVLESEDYRNIRKLAVKRIMASYTGKIPKIVDYEERFLTFHIAKLILTAMKDPVITRRYANMERDILEENLRTNPEDIGVVAKNFRLRFKRVKKKIEIYVYHYQLHFIDFIRFAKNFSMEDFMLINQPLSNGQVLLTQERFIKIIREAFVESFVKDVERDSKYAALVEKSMKNEIEKIRNLKDEYLSKYTPVELGDIESDAFPPCIKSIIAKINDGVNVPHQARFSLVTFLHRLGMKEEEILKIFATVPDFKKDLTIYQIRHITGKISGKEYSVPKCATMRSYGLCVRDAVKDSLCFKPWMTHPLLYYKIRVESIRKGASRRKKTAAKR